MEKIEEGSNPKQDARTARYHKVMPALISALKKITGNACTTCTDKNKCFHWTSYKEWSKWWSQNKNDFTIVDPE